MARTASRRNGRHTLVAVRPLTWLMAATSSSLVFGIAAGLGIVTWLAAALAMVALVVLVWRWVEVGVALFLAAAASPALVQTIDFLPADALTLSGGIRVVDVILLAMGAAVVARLLSLLPRTRSLRLPFGILVAVAVTAAWLFAETLRNLGVYGLSTFGELRYSYLVLLVAPYVALFASTPARRIRLAWLTVLAGLWLPATAPWIILSHEWMFGPTSRVFPAVVALGMVYAMAASYLLERATTTRLPRLILYIATVATILLVVVDGHRSVWLAALGVSLVLNRQRPTEAASGFLVRIRRHNDCGAGRSRLRSRCRATAVSAES